MVYHFLAGLQTLRVYLHQSIQDLYFIQVDGDFFLVLVTVLIVRHAHLIRHLRTMLSILLRHFLITADARQQPSKYESVYFSAQPFPNDMRFIVFEYFYKEWTIFIEVVFFGEKVDTSWPHFIDKPSQWFSSYVFQ